MKIYIRDKLDDVQKERVRELWNRVYPEKLVHETIEDFDHYLNGLTEKRHYLLSGDEDVLCAWAVIFTRDDERWFAILIAEEYHGKGFGTKMLNRLKEDESILNGWAIDHNSDKKANGGVYKSPLGFYKKNGFDILSNIRLALETISAVKVRWKK